MRQQKKQMLKDLFNNLSKKRGKSMLSFNAKTLFISGTIFLLIDSFYLKSMSWYFNKLIKNVQGKEITMKLLGAVLCYIFLIVGLNVFIIQNGQYEKDLEKRVLYAGLLGLLVYGVYETTNYAIIDKWDLQTVLIDTVWGGILFSLTTYLTSFSE